MNKSKVAGCLWVFIELLCLALFLVLFVAKLLGAPISWRAVFGPLIGGLSITTIIITMVLIIGVLLGNHGEE